MGVLLERARQVFGSGPRELPPAEPFEIACACGQHVTGFRLDHRQFVCCPGCGQLHLVLPISPYPRPISYETPTRATGVLVEVVRPKRPFGVRVRIRMRRARRSTGAFLWALVPPARWFSPIRLLMAAMVFVVVGTAGLTVHLTRRGGLTGDIVAARVAWTKHLEAGDFAKARSVLDQAAAEIKRYGDDSRELREVDHLAREVALFADFPERPWEDLLQEVRSMGPQECAEYFRDKLKSPSVVLDLYVSPSGAGPSSFRVDNRLFLGSDVARLDLSDLKLFKLLSPGLSTRILFGARIQSVERSPGSDDRIIRLMPDSGVLITSEMCLGKISWPIDETARKLLESQLKWVLEQP